MASIAEDTTHCKSFLGHNRGPSFEGGETGWIAVARGLRSHWLVGFGQPVAPVEDDRGAYSRSEAWIDLIMECRYSAGTVNNNGKRMRLEQGQLLGAVSWLASRWNWTPKTVRGFLDKLEGEGMISRFAPGSDDVLNGHQKGKKKGKFSTVLTICNYALYQLGERSQGQDAGTAEGELRASSGQVEGNIYKEETREQGNKTNSKGARARESPVVNCETISHPNFVIDLQAVLQGAALIGMKPEEAKARAEVIARDWAANGYRPTKPAHYVVEALQRAINEKAIQGVRVDKARGQKRDSEQERFERMKRL